MGSSIFGSSQQAKERKKLFKRIGSMLDLQGDEVRPTAARAGPGPKRHPPPPAHSGEACVPPRGGTRASARHQRGVRFPPCVCAPVRRPPLSADASLCAARQSARRAYIAQRRRPCLRRAALADPAHAGGDDARAHGRPRVGRPAGGDHDLARHPHRWHPGVVCPRERAPPLAASDRACECPLSPRTLAARYPREPPASRHAISPHATCA
eukprot:1083749-Prymnesium_polylepis.2